MKRRVVGVAAGLAAAVAALAGCAPTPLARDAQVEALLKENRRVEDLLIASENRVAQLSEAGKPPPEAPPKMEDPFVAIAVRFGKYCDILGAAGKPAGREPLGRTTDERLKVVLEPLDGEGDVVKRLGALELEAFEGDAATAKPFAAWRFPPEELAKTWLSGLGTYAYVLKLPWPADRPPKAGPVHLRARFTPLGGGPLEAETTLTRRP